MNQQNQNKQPSSNNVVDLRNGERGAQGTAGTPQHSQQPQQQFQQDPLAAEKPKSGKLTQFLLGCCIFLLLILIGIGGLGAYYTKRVVTILQEKGVTDIGKFFDEHVGNVIKESIQNGINNQSGDISPEDKENIENEFRDRLNNSQQ